jgi:hypothetical protein
VELISKLLNHDRIFQIVDGGLFLAAPIYVVFMLFKDPKLWGALSNEKQEWVRALKDMWDKIAGSRWLMLPSGHIEVTMS